MRQPNACKTKAGCRNNMQSVWEREHEVFKVAVMFGPEVKASDSAVERAKGTVVLGKLHLLAKITQKDRSLIRY